MVVDAVPRTLNGKKCEVPVKKILAGVAPEKAVSRGALLNPDALAPLPRPRGPGGREKGWTALCRLVVAGGSEPPGGFA